MEFFDKITTWLKINLSKFSPLHPVYTEAKDAEGKYILDEYGNPEGEKYQLPTWFVSAFQVLMALLVITFAVILLNFIIKLLTLLKLKKV
jgi:hypothetical protein